jgi:hypothetical protein
VKNLVKFWEVLVIEPLDDIEFVIEHVETACKIPIRGEESMLSKFVQIVDFNGVVFIVFGGP